MRAASVSQRVWVLNDKRLRRCQSVFDFEDFFCNGHLQLVDLGQVREPAVFFTVEDFFPVQVNLQAAFAIWG